MAHLSFILFPGFPMLPYALAREALALANRMAGETLFTCDTRVPGHGQSQASNGAVMAPDRPDWGDPEKVDLGLVLCGDQVPGRIPNGFQSFLRQIDAAGGRLGGVETGTLILARIGHLDGRRAVLVRGEDGDRDEVFAGLQPSERPYVLDDRRLTVAGGVAAGDALCAWIAETASPALADEVARALATGRVRTHAATATEAPAEPSDPVIAEMEARMRAHLADPLPLSELADSLGLSRKALRGRCMRALGAKPSDHYLTLRLQHGAELLRHTAMPVSDIARQSGFDTLAGFSRSIRNTLGVSPSAVRKMARAARMVAKYA
ncbi:GlxA family transcriptional regulator [Roseicyclus persicicus]|uniref:Helix-turn-helix domain-containing protein n=1 Tax=Roseicyclus persicicus TaxID=2650661 RepID=A0A7X6JZS5_9RHOB|nr:helix-turn-helix domain-containing protein [Roseibacterium persicicum]NKX45854.1 helix-turn-helix domain-containing protein [Roseibacterium persicicum]